jgi:hypothetical protein
MNHLVKNRFYFSKNSFAKMGIRSKQQVNIVILGEWSGCILGFLLGSYEIVSAKSLLTPCSTLFL